MKSVDLVAEITGVPEVMARTALACILRHKPMVTLSAEADVTVGAILTTLARNAGTVYTLSSGDEPGAILQLHEFAANLGFKVIVAGKGKNNPLNRAATPDDCGANAKSSGLDTKMLTSFVDGTKTMVEMTAVGNCIGLRPDVSGMHGPTTTVKTLTSTFSTQAEGGILNGYGVVDFAVGDVAPGVFAIFTTDQPVVKQDLAFYNMGKGPNYLLYRPYHLCSLEMPLAITRAYCNNDYWIVPRYLLCEATTVAKRDLKAGEALDGIGGYAVRGGMETAALARKENMLPIGMVYGTHMTRDVRAGETLRYADVELNEKSVVVQLRRLQDALFAAQIESGAPLWTPGSAPNVLGDALTQVLNLVAR
jgi:predicted homoserine dehydrogenase-like protein